MEPPRTTLDPETVIAKTRTWIERAVIGLNLCPFAKAVYVKDQIRYVVSPATTTEGLLVALRQELEDLALTQADTIDTTLLIHPLVLQDFVDYNDFITLGHGAIRQAGLTQTFQLATFHPAYQFTNTAADDVANYTNRSPYPMLQLLREASVDHAVATHTDTDRIYLKNIETMRRLGTSGLRALGLA